MFSILSLLYSCSCSNLNQVNKKKDKKLELNDNIGIEKIIDHLTNDNEFIESSKELDKKLIQIVNKEMLRKKEN